MRSLVFDTSSIISIATNNLLNSLEPLKKQFAGEFYVSETVHKEVVDNPLNSRRFKLEALMIQELFDRGVIKIYDDPSVREYSLKLLEMLNNTFSTRKKYIKIVDLAEVESLVLANKLQSQAYVVDERTMRLAVENPTAIAEILKNKIHESVKINYENVYQIKKEFFNMPILRSTELMLIGYKIGLFNDYMGKNKKEEHEFLDGLLWALKLHGCSITDKEIDDFIKHNTI